jgi:exosortase D (VPLPA-CTERM-specific)
MLMKRDSALDTEPAPTKPLYLGLLVSVSVLLGLIGFGESLLELAHRWNVEEEYHYGYVIPVIVAWLLWSRRDALRASVGQPSWAGAALIVLAAAMHIVGEFSSLYILSQLGFIVALMGIALGFGGYSLLRLSFIPIIFLIFAIPVPYFIEAMLSLKLQLISSQLGTFFIRMFQIPVYLAGNVIDLGNYKLQVVDACSGLRYLYPLMSLGFLAAYFFQAPFWQRALVFLSTIPITIFMNSFRIGVVGLIVDNFGPQDADGFLHMFEGWIIFVACTCLLVGEMTLLARFANRKHFLDMFDAPKVGAVPPDLRATTSSAQAPLLSCLVLVAATGIAGSFVSTRHEIVPEHRPFAMFPTTVGDWHGQVSSLDPETVASLGLTDYILTDYINPDHRDVNFYVAYYASQRTGLAPHSPSVCLPGNGWQIAKFEHSVFYAGNFSFPINRVVMDKGSERELVYYWFDERGMTIANEWLSKLYLLRDAIFKNRTDGALVRLVTPIYPGELESDADKRLHDFTQVIAPKLAGYLPAEPQSKIEPAMISPKADHS